MVAKACTNANNGAIFSLCCRGFLGVFLGYDGRRTETDEEDEGEGDNGEGGKETAVLFLGRPSEASCSHGM
jgi:hypothetical protein